MRKKLKKNGLIEGSMIAYISVIITKILGALYIIPFYSIIGESGIFIYSAAYTLYNLVLDASTSGVPTAISILISEHNTLGLQKTKRRIYAVGAAVVSTISIILFLLIQIFAAPIAGFFMDGMAPGTVVNNDSIATGLRCMSFCLLFAPFLSVKRGYLQGHNFIANSSYSQVVEQVVRIAVVLIGSYVAVKVLILGENVGADIALSGAAVAAVAALIYLHFSTRGFEHDLAVTEDEETVPKTRDIILMILRYSIPVVIVAVSTHIYELVDMKCVLIGMQNVGYSDALTQTVSSTIATKAPKICMIISALSMGLTASLVPSMTSSFVKKDYEDVNRKFNLSLSTIFVVTLPLCFGIALLARPIFALFYASSDTAVMDIGTYVLTFACFVSVLSSVKVVICMALQSLGRAKLVCGCTILGLVINAACDLPLIYLFNIMGLPPYLGTVLSTALGESTIILIIMINLKRTMKFSYRSIINVLFKAIIPNAALCAVVVMMKMFINIPDTRSIGQFLLLCAFAAVGGAVYVLLAYKLKLLQLVFGDDMINNLLRRLHIKK